MTRRGRIETAQLGTDMDAVRTRYAPAHVLEQHAHEGAALSIPFGGEFLEIFGRHEFRIDRQCALYKRPEFAHKNVVGPRGFDGVLVQISGERHRWITEAVGPLGENDLIRDRHVEALARSFRMAWDAETPGRLLTLESLALQVLARFHQRRADRHRPHWLQGVIEDLHDTFPRRPALELLAKRARVHPVHLAQAFSHHVGCSIGAYVERMRVQAVGDALRASDKTLAQIAIESGFSDQSHMTRVFARAVGTTPGRYRRGVGPKPIQKACE